LLKKEPSHDLYCDIMIRKNLEEWKEPVRVQETEGMISVRENNSSSKIVMKRVSEKERFREGEMQD
jgi:hypothetical protein